MAKAKRRWCAKLLGAVLAAAALWLLYAATRPIDEVQLTIGEPYEQVRQRSRSTLPPVEPGGHWGGVVTRPAKLRFIDPQYGFTTPPAKFLSVAYDGHGNVISIRMSPQVKTLPLNETMEIVTDLQNQLLRGGWTRFRVVDDPPIENTPSVKARIRRCEAPTEFWEVATKFQLMLDVRCFRIDENPDDERYLISISLSTPWVSDDAR
ncbi:hypothetical protein [Cupriavidus sp. BIS7]|uniref:hypothetical protein n=1 Tax=Cupriavidus sp. BIS7 TaxID=1217718 RepID=UPI00047506A4|nr:hypothetical protein [Cupriavidus sp. BIS7]